MKYRVSSCGWGLVLAVTLSGCTQWPTTLTQSMPVIRGDLPHSAEHPSKPADETLPAQEAARLLVVHGDKLVERGREAQALAQYEKARALQPHYPGLTHKLALLYDRLLQDHKAQVEYLRALQEQPDNPALLNDFGYFHYLRGRYVEAERYFRQALTACERNASFWPSSRATDNAATKSGGEALRQRVYVNLGLALAQQDKLQESFAAFTRVLPPAQAHYNIAVVLLQRAGHMPEQPVAEQQRLRQLARQHLHLALQHDASLRLAQALLETLDNPKPAPDQPPAAHAPPRHKVSSAAKQPRLPAISDPQSSTLPSSAQRKINQSVQQSMTDASPAPSAEGFRVVIPPPPVPLAAPTTMNASPLTDDKHLRERESAAPPTNTTNEPKRPPRPLRRPLRDDSDSP